MDQTSGSLFAAEAKSQTAGDGERRHDASEENLEIVILDAELANHNHKSENDNCPLSDGTKSSRRANIGSLSRSLDNLLQSASQNSANHKDQNRHHDIQKVR